VNDNPSVGHDSAVRPGRQNSGFMNALTFRLIGVRADGTESVLMTGMTLDAAKDAQADTVVKGDYAKLRIEPDAPPRTNLPEDSSGR
jgi:hypothetical protein